MCVLVLWTEKRMVFCCECQSWYSKGLRKQTSETSAKASEVSDITSTAVFPGVSQALYSGPLETL